MADTVQDNNTGPKIEPPVQNAYQRATGKKLSPDGQMRFASIKEQLNIRSDDAIWGVAFILEMYTRIIEDYNRRMKGALFEAIKEYVAKGGTINIAADPNSNSGHFNVRQALFALGMIFSLCVLSFVAGANIHATAPPWMYEKYGIVNALLGAPSGWILLILIGIPAGMQVKEGAGKMKFETDKKERALIVIQLIALCLVIVVGIVLAIKTIFPGS
jgi:hypothetical protein